MEHKAHRATTTDAHRPATEARVSTKRLPAFVAHSEAGVGLLDRPGRREAAAGEA